MFLQWPRDSNAGFYVLIKTALEGWRVALWVTPASTQEPLVSRFDPSTPHPSKEKLLTEFSSEKWERASLRVVLPVLFLFFCFLWESNPGLTHARQSLYPFPFYSIIFTEISAMSKNQNSYWGKVPFLFCGCWGPRFQVSGLCSKHLPDPLSHSSSHILRILGKLF